VTKIRRGGYVFITWKGDHAPRHVHVFRGRALVAKWDLDRDVSMFGDAPRSVRDLIDEMKREGVL
jgi:hypothetical protein